MIHFVVGTRAQLLKLAPIMRECMERGLRWRWIYTAQHREAIDTTLATFELPDPDVAVVAWEREASTMTSLAGWLLRALWALTRGRRILGGHTGPDNLIVTHGDTITTWWGALLGRLYRCKVMHVESGLRSFNLREPFPEEVNRLITFRLSHYFACPGEWALRNMSQSRGEAFDTELNTHYDALQFALKQTVETEVDIPNEPYVVVSIHRYENVYDEERFVHVIECLELIADRFLLLFVLHPVTEQQLRRRSFYNRLDQNPRIRLLPRLDYVEFIGTIKEAEFVVTDGGGNQEELHFLGKPTLLFRHATERQDGIGSTTLVSELNQDRIIKFLDDYPSYRHPPTEPAASPSKIVVDWLADRGYGT